ncbi:MAG: hypothetical protein KGJ60_07780 [Verrucomicrobiota bacterium]|nr:hypothetical protein [Verrucomicrobiota bacterium]
METLVNPYAHPGVSFYGSSRSPLASNATFIRAVHTAEAKFGATGYGYGECNLFTTDYNTWYSWFTNALLGDSNRVYQALYNYDSMCGKPSVEQALLDVQREATRAKIGRSRTAGEKAEKQSCHNFSISLKIRPS